MRCLAVAAIALVAAPGLGFCRSAGDAIQAQAVAFYRWYLDHADDRSIAVERPKAGMYLTASYRKQLEATYRANGFAEGADPFLGVQDYDAANWKTHLTTDAPTGLTVDPRVVVHFGTGDGSAQVCVHFRLAGGTWKISQVDPADDAQAPADCRTKS